MSFKGGVVVGGIQKASLIFLIGVYFCFKNCHPIFLFFSFVRKKEESREFLPTQNYTSQS